MAEPAPDAQRGALLYQRYCAGCHAPDGSGNGRDARVLATRPRDLRGLGLAKISNEALVARIRSGTPLRLELDPEALRREIIEVDQLVDYLRQIPEIDWPRLEPGWDLYAGRCQDCHGPYGEGGEGRAGIKAAPALIAADGRQTYSEDELVESVRSGHRNMPALLPRLSEAEARQVALFTRHFSPGFQVYSRNCANCHSDDGRGQHSLGSVLGEEIALPTVEFDRAYMRRTQAASLRRSAWHMLDGHKPSMPHFRLVLPDPALRDIAEHLRTKLVVPDPPLGATPAERQ